MFCSKCGKELPNDAVFCTYCGNQTSNSAPVQQTEPHPQPVYTPPQPVYMPQKPVVHYRPAAPMINGYETHGTVKLTQKENYTIIATGLIYIIVEILMTLINWKSYSLMVDGEFVTVVSIILGCVIAAFFGVAAILKKRWAFLTIRVFMILGIVSNALSVIFTFVLTSASGSAVSSAGVNAQVQLDLVSLLLLLLSIGYQVVMVIFTSSCARVLSQETQNFRSKTDGKKLIKHYEIKSEGNEWVCAKCGAHNSIGNSFCKDCGSYK